MRFLAGLSLQDWLCVWGSLLVVGYVIGRWVFRR